VTKRVKIKILPDGTIEAMTQGVKGKDCLGYVRLFEELLNAEAVDSDFTSEYYELGGVFIHANQQQTLDQNY
jgi:Protein of unknown function (DUF2997)